MSRSRRFRVQCGFTLIEILVVIVIIGVLSILGVSKYTEFTRSSRTRGCVSNQNAIDKAVGVWESQYVAVPAVAATKGIDFDTKGAIVNSDFGALLAPAAAKLTSPSKTVFNFTKDLNVFACPERTNIAGSDVIATTAETDFGWRISTGANALLNGRTRGVLCITFNANGPDGTTSTQHR